MRRGTDSNRIRSLGKEDSSTSLLLSVTMFQIIKNLRNLVLKTIFPLL